MDEMFFMLSKPEKIDGSFDFEITDDQNVGFEDLPNDIEEDCCYLFCIWHWTFPIGWESERDAEIC